MSDYLQSANLPVAAKQLISQVNQLFVEFVGPIGKELAEDVFVKWVADGKFGPSAIRRYAHMLSEQLDVVSERHAFLQKAEKLLLQ